jgi:manganese transport protein
MNRILGLALGILSSIGGFVDVGDIVASGTIGARYGLSLLWVLVLGVIGICCYADMSGRIAAASGRPVYDLIRERLGPSAAMVNLGAALLVTLMTLTAQIGGIALIFELASDIPHVVWVVPIGLVLWLIIWRVRFQRLEKIIGLSGLTVLVFSIAVWWLEPDWGSLAAQAVAFAPPPDEALPTYFFFAVALFAAAMTPYEVFFFSSGGIEDGWKRKDHRSQRVNVMLGFPLGGLLSLGIMAATAVALRPTGMDVSTLGQVVLPVMMAFGVVGAIVAMFGLMIACTGAAFETAMTCGYTLAQYFGWTWGKSLRPAKAARFHVAVAGTLLIAMVIVQTGLDPIMITEYSLVFSALALPLTYIPVLVVANDCEYMGDLANGKVANFFGVLTMAVILVASVTSIPLMIMTGTGA